MQFANDYPERTAALILLSAVSQASAPSDQTAFHVGIIHTIQRSDFAYWLVSKLFQSAVLDLMGVPAAAYATVTPAERQLAHAMLGSTQPMSQPRPGTINDGLMLQRQTVSTGSVSAPVLILHAKDDARVSHQHAECAHQAMKHSQLISYDAGGHGLLSKAADVRRAVSKFLQRL
jgi:pimeloyl-ACP methyl ester carboxylesterase